MTYLEQPGRLRAPPVLSYWHIPRDEAARPRQEYAFRPDDTPLVFYFGGIPVMQRQIEPEHDVRMEVKRYLGDDVKHQQYRLLIVSERDEFKYDRAGRYLEDPQHYYHRGAEEFTHNVLLPRIRGCESVDEIKARLGRITLIGHSYGTVFIQCVSNALRGELQEHSSFSPQEIREIMQSVAALNIGPVASPVEKDADFTQFSILATGDKSASEHIDIDSLLEDKHPLLGHGWKGNSHLLLISRQADSYVRALKISGKGEINSLSEEDADRHSLRFYMNTETHPRPDLTTFQTNPSAHLAHDFLAASVNGALTSTREHPRDMHTWLQGMEQKLTPEAKDNIAALLKKQKNWMRDYLLAAANNEAEHTR